MSIVKMENIIKDYFTGKITVQALSDINIDIKRGDFVVLAGPSGSGKTTLLNMIGCMDKPTTGNIVIDGEEITGFDHKEASQFRRDKIGFIFQAYNLIPVLTAYENIEFSLNLIGRYSREDKMIKIEKMMNDVDILQYKHRRPAEMSGGQQQRVAVARALIKNPAIVLADEPTANLDSVTGENILKLMRKLNEELNVTFIFSSHDKMVIDYAKRVIKLRDGRIESDERKG
jgi:putative ABC transport system ATP-binding protein